MTIGVISLWRPRPWVAALLNVPVPGLGLIYAGRPGRAAMHLVCGAALLLAFVWVSCWTTIRGVRLVSLLLFLSAGVVALPWDAYVAAGRTPAGSRRAFQRRGAIAVIFVASGLLIQQFTTRIVGRVAQVYRVQGTAMHPTLTDGDRVVGKTIARHDIARFDVVIYDAMGGRRFTGRVVGFPGDTVEVRGYRAIVNGQPEVSRAGPCLGDLGIGASAPRVMPDSAPARVPPGNYFLLGDCRDNAVDSRVLGTIPGERISARVSWMLWPATRTASRYRIGDGID